MQFTESEVRFLRQENAIRKIKPMLDLRELGCPEHIFEKVLESRRHKLGPEFAKFREQQGTSLTTPARPDLDARIAAARLF